MATKLEGWEYQKGQWGRYDEITFYRHFVGKEEEPSERPATLVIHDDKPEPVYTASEVLPDIESLLKWVHRETAFLRECGKPQPEAERMVGFMATRYGIKLDPA